MTEIERKMIWLVMTCSCGAAISHELSAREANEVKNLTPLRQLLSPSIDADFSLFHKTHSRHGHVYFGFANLHLVGEEQPTHKWEVN